MKSNLKKLAMTSTLSLIAGYANIAYAHDLSNQTLGAALGATDYFQVTCFNDGNGNATRLDIQVNDDTAGASLLSLQVQKGLIARNTTDPVGANGVFSPYVSVPGANGVYNVIVDKTTAAARQYDIRYHCMTIGNLHTGTTISQKQNQ